MNSVLFNVIEDIKRVFRRKQDDARCEVQSAKACGEISFSKAATIDSPTTCN